MEVHMYHKRIESLGELHEVIDALETLGKEYKVVKKIEWTEPNHLFQNYRGRYG